MNIMISTWVYTLNSIQVMNEGHLSGMSLLAVNVVEVDKHLKPLKDWVVSFQLIEYQW